MGKSRWYEVRVRGLAKVDENGNVAFDHISFDTESEGEHRKAIVHALSPAVASLVDGLGDAIPARDDPENAVICKHGIIIDCRECAEALDAARRRSET